MKVDIKVNDIEAGKQYSMNSLAKTLGIVKNTLTNNYNQIFDEISNCWQFETTYTKSGQPRFTFKKQVLEYIQKDKRKEFDELAYEVVREQPLNTPTNVGRILNNDQEFPEVATMNYSPRTKIEYAKVAIKRAYGAKVEDRGSFDDVDDMNNRKGYIDQKVWCRLDSVHNAYIPLTEEQYGYFMQLLHPSEEQMNQEMAAVASDFLNGQISRKEAQEEIMGEAGIFDNYVARLIAAKKQFKEKFHFCPTQAKHYVTYGWNQDQL